MRQIVLALYTEGRKLILNALVKFRHTSNSSLILRKHLNYSTFYKESKPLVILPLKHLFERN